MKKSICILSLSYFLVVFTGVASASGLETLKGKKVNEIIALLQGGGSIYGRTILAGISSANFTVSNIRAKMACDWDFGAFFESLDGCADDNGEIKLQAQIEVTSNSQPLTGTDLSFSDAVNCQGAAGMIMSMGFSNRSKSLAAHCEGSILKTEVLSTSPSAEETGKVSHELSAPNNLDQSKVSDVSAKAQDLAAQEVSQGVPTFSSAGGL